MSHHRVSRLLVVGATVVGAAVSLVGPASAKEPSGTVTFSTLPPPPPPGTCQPVQSLKTLGDTRIGEAVAPTISIDYSVKPCDSKQVVTVEALVAQTTVPTNVLYDDTAAPLDNRFLVGVALNTSYRVTITVRDAGTGALVGSLSQTASASTRTTA